jgi:sarcosine oxidase
MIRQAYFEDPAYVPLLFRSYELWRELERETAEQLLRLTGVLSVGNEESQIISGTKHSAAQHGLGLEVLGRRQLHERYPTLRLLPDEIALFEPDGGVLDPERAIKAHLQVAQNNGAHLRFQASMQEWEASENGVTIRLSDGTSLSARKLILSLGPWFKEMMDALGASLRIQRNVQAWFSPSLASYRASEFPAFLLDRAGLSAPLYGFPDFGDGVKAAFHGFGAITTADEIDREVNMTRDVAPIAAAMEEWMPGASANFREAQPCMYSLTPDGHFVIDHHPRHANVILCGGFSGHGFKFAPVVGEIAAELALDGGSRHQIDFLSLQRFTASSGK